MIHRADLRGLGPDADGVVLVRSDGTRRFHSVVVAAGAWSAQQLKTMGLHAPLETGRGCHRTVPDSGVTINNTPMRAEHMIVAPSTEGGLRFARMVELARLKPPPNYRRAQTLATLGHGMFPKLCVGEASEWMGHRPSLPDSLPVIGRAPGYRNVLLAFGHSHPGLSGGAPTGRLIAPLAGDRPPSIDPTPFQMDRFQQ